MRNLQKGSVTVWIIIIVVILVGIGFYFYSQSKNPVAFSQAVETNSQAETSTTWQTYDAKPFPFSVKLPKGDSLASREYGDGVMLDYRIANTPTELNSFRGVEIAKDNECPKGNTETINGISFTIKPDQGYFGGMESGSIDAFYCTVYNGSQYTLFFTAMYARPNGKIPDQAQSMLEFDKEARLLNLKFTSSN